MSNEPIDYINRDIVNVKNDIKAFKETVAQELQMLNKIVFQGNGQPSIVQQLTGLSNDVNSVKRGFESFKEDQKNNSRLSWHFKTAILVALIASFTAFYLNWQDRVNPPTVRVESSQTQNADLNANLAQILKQQQDQSAALLKLQQDTAAALLYKQQQDNKK